MNTPSSQQTLLQQIAAITRMEGGKLCVMREGPNGPYYNHQCWRDGHNVTEYVPAAQLEVLRENLEAHERFKDLVSQYERLIAEQTRQERKTGELKKKHPLSKSSSPRKPKSKP